MLGVVYTMDHEVVLRLCKICDWLLNLSNDHFSLHQGKNFYSDHGVLRSPKYIFKGIHYSLTYSPTCLLVGEANRGALVGKKTRGP